MMSPNVELIKDKDQDEEEREALNPDNYIQDQAPVEVERIGDEILLEGMYSRIYIDKPSEIRKATITSLDKIHKYSNLFICVHPFILNGYRIHHTLKDCVASLFTLHNETLNIWTHLVPFLGFLAIFVNHYTCN